MKKIIEKQRTFFLENRTRALEFRVKQLKQLRRMIKENESALFEAIRDDFKKSVFDTYSSELVLLYHDIKEALKNIHKWSRKQKVRTNIVNQPGKSYIIAEPLGVSLIIGAWNYPYQLSLGPVIPALAAGNTVVLKPSELPVHTSHLMTELVAKYFDPALFTVIEGGIPETTALLNEKFDKIFFTGSVPVGKIVYQAAAKHLTPVTLELGGKSPAIFTKSCHLKMGIKRMIWAKFFNAGQTCIAPDYVVVHRSIEEQFLELAVKEIEKESFAVENDNYVQIINTENVRRLGSMLDGVTVHYGGKYDEQNRIFEPTLIRDVAFDDPVMEDEIFGPILPVIAYDDLDAVIAEIKSRPKPLACYVFTNNSNVRDKILREVSFGGGAVNDAIMHIANSALPFGGVGQSGTGAYHGHTGFRAFSHYKSVLEKATWFEANLKYAPHTKLKLEWIKRLFM